MRWLLCVAAVLLQTAGSSTRAAEHNRTADSDVNVTVFHVHPASFSSSAPINMDLGDAAGDMFFSLHRSVLSAFEFLHGCRCVFPNAYASCAADRY